MSGVLVDREALENLLAEITDLCETPWDVNQSVYKPLLQQAHAMLSALALPAQAAADAAGVLRQVALMAEAIQTADRLPEGSEDRRWAFTDYVNVESRLRREDPARLRALADALEVQG